MNRDRLLAQISAAQLATGVTGLVLALRRGYPYDVPLMHGRRERIARDWVNMGTALSAPLTMLVPQWIATMRVLRGRSSRADRRILGGLGAAMILGYVSEAHVRRRLSRAGYDQLETSLIVAALVLSGAMAWLGLSRSSTSHANPSTPR